MTEDELLALYGSMKQMAAAMKLREAALHAAIVELKQIPDTLGRQTSQYIAAGVRQSIQDDFSRPIADAVKGTIAELSRETYHARIVMEQVGKEVRYQSWTWVAVLVLLGFALGGASGYYLFVRDINQVSDRLDAIQVQLTPAAEAAPASLREQKGKTRR